MIPGAFSFFSTFKFCISVMIIFSPQRGYAGFFFGQLFNKLLTPPARSLWIRFNCFILNLDLNLARFYKLLF